MYRKILVPLDGSKLAECVLPHVEALAKAFQVQEVVFVRVFEPYRPPPSDYVISEEERGRIDADYKAAAEKYLRELVDEVHLDGVRQRWDVLRGRIAETLADYASKNNVDLIVIATHGRSGVSRWVWGSVAD
ncbi:MAG: universal stress protein, partial [Syntrophaceae bacterium]|nr:universal stress protein [Syntrophaceae bacterium]